MYGAVWLILKQIDLTKSSNFHYENRSKIFTKTQPFSFEKKRLDEGFSAYNFISSLLYMCKGRQCNAQCMQTNVSMSVYFSYPSYIMLYVDTKRWFCENTPVSCSQTPSCSCVNTETVSDRYTKPTLHGIYDTCIAFALVLL